MNPPERQTPERKRTRIQAENEARIVKAALGVFAAMGYRGATVDRIAEEAQMSKANVLYYFRRKNDIYLAVLEQTLSAWLDPLIELDPDGEPLEQLWDYTRSKLLMSRQDPIASRLFANEILNGAPMIRPFLEHELKPLVQDRCAVVQHWINQGQLAPIEPLHLMFLIWSATQHYADFAPQIDALHDGDNEQLYADAERTLKTLLLGGLKPSKAPQTSA